MLDFFLPAYPVVSLQADNVASDQRKWEIRARWVRESLEVERLGRSGPRLETGRQFIASKAGGKHSDSREVLQEGLERTAHGVRDWLNGNLLPKWAQ